MKELGRKCSHCKHIGHNTRTCNGKGCTSVKLFGVTIVADHENTNKDEESFRKSKSSGDLLACNGEHIGVDEGYATDGLILSKNERKKGVPWTEDEHRSFLAGLEKLGKGDWRGISKNYVPTRTPTQVASHAQKYFIRLVSTDKKKRRSSLFDMSYKEPQIQHSPPQESLDEISQADSSPSPPPLETPPVLPLPTNYGVPPNFRQVQYMPMVGFSGTGQSLQGPKVLQTVSLVPVMNLPNHGYYYMPKSYGNFATCAPYMSQSSIGCLFPPPIPHRSSQAATLASPETSLTKKDGLDLHIGVN